MENLQKEKTIAAAAAKASMSENTARKYRDLGRLPSEVRQERYWRTREDPFEEVWPEIESVLENNRHIEASTVFDYLQREYPGRFADGQIRTLQRRVKEWRATAGPPKEVFFAQVHKPGELCESDFTHMSELEITVDGQPFNHILYHLVLTYSNWETATICYSENFQALSVGFQAALWELGGVPKKHRTDRLSTAVHNDVENPEEFTRKYNALLSHYRIEGAKIQSGEPHENGDIEQAHNRLKSAVAQALMLRGSKDFGSVDEYKVFLRGVLKQKNAGRRERFEEEIAVLNSLPARKLESADKVKVRVGPGSSIHVKHNTYSVDSRLRGERVEARVHVDHIEVWYAQKMVDSFPRLRGTSKHRINYRHVIDSLVRKPGAFENYRYREDMFPTSTFRVAYDRLKCQPGARADKEYLKILHLAATESESGVEKALYFLIDLDSEITAKQVEELVALDVGLSAPADVEVDQLDLASYDGLLAGVVR